MQRLFFYLFLLSQSIVIAQDFEVLPLGIYGGGDESNLSSYLIRDFQQKNYIACDAGTLRAGLIMAQSKGYLEENPIHFLKNNVKAYFISHSHLDHLSGLIINSPEDSPKPIYAFPETVEVFKKHYFISATWSNFSTDGEEPTLNTYTYYKVQENKSYPITETNLTLKVFPLSHPVPSAAAWLHNSVGNSILYLGDTGADRIEGNTHLKHLWKTIASELKMGKLKTILIEVSFANTQPENRLFGHLTPRLLTEELQKLAEYTGIEKLKDFPIVITHIKPYGDSIVQIKRELEENNPLQVNYIFPEQGVPLQF